jgi:large subunit ribosomal protein L24
MGVQTVSKTRIKKGDTVMVIAGRERGKTGKVLSLQLNDGKVTVEKLNIIKRHTKPNQKNRQGGILEREAPLAISNVMLLCSNCNKPVRTGIKILDDGRRVRMCKKCNEVIEKV